MSPTRARDTCAVLFITPPSKGCKQESSPNQRPPLSSGADLPAPAFRADMYGAGPQPPTERLNSKLLPPTKPASAAPLATRRSTHARRRPARSTTQPLERQSRRSQRRGDDLVKHRCVRSQLPPTEKASSVSWRTENATRVRGGYIHEYELTAAARGLDFCTHALASH